MVVKNQFFYIIPSHWFPVHHQIAALNRVFNDDIESRNDLGVAREIRRVIVPKKIIMIFISFFIIDF